MVLWQVSLVVEGLLLVVLAVLMLGVLRYLSGIQERINLVAPPVTRLQLGDTMPTLTLQTFDGSRLKLETLLASRRSTVVLFTIPNCAGCKVILDQLRDLAGRDTARHSRKQVVLVAAGAIEEKIRELLSTLAESGITVLLDEDATAMGALSIRVTPTGLSFDEQGVLTAQSWNPHAGDWLYRQLRSTPPTPSSPKSLVPIAIARADDRRR